MTQEEFKNKLSEINFTPKDFSEETGISYSTINKYGKQNPVPMWVHSWLKIFIENKELKSASKTPTSPAKSNNKETIKDLKLKIFELSEIIEQLK